MIVNIIGVMMEKLMVMLMLSKINTLMVTGKMMVTLIGTMMDMVIVWGGRWFGKRIFLSLY